MYYLYCRTGPGEHVRFTRIEEVHLFGCRQGVIPRLLARRVPSAQNQPYQWHLDVSRALAEDGMAGGTLVIDLKPAQRIKNLSLYEVLDVWGFSSHGWTPIMMRLRGLFVDDAPTAADPEDFFYDLGAADHDLFSMMYLSGTIIGGKLAGKWTPPGPSPTNSVLLWPEVLTYFMREAGKFVRVETFIETQVSA